MLSRETALFEGLYGTFVSSRMAKALGSSSMGCVCCGCCSEVLLLASTTADPKTCKKELADAQNAKPTKRVPRARTPPPAEPSDALAKPAVLRRSVFRSPPTSPPRSVVEPEPAACAVAEDIAVASPTKVTVAKIQSPQTVPAVAHRPSGSSAELPAALQRPDLATSTGPAPCARDEAGQPIATSGLIRPPCATTPPKRQPARRSVFRSPPPSPPSVTAAVSFESADPQQVSGTRRLPPRLPAGSEIAAEGPQPVLQEVVPEAAALRESVEPDAPKGDGPYPSFASIAGCCRCCQPLASPHTRGTPGLGAAT
jgi:hypothetical protein